MEALDAALTTIRVAVGDAPYNVNFFAHGLWQAEQLAGRRIILACNDFDLIKAGVAAETGIGLLPDFYVRPEDGFVQVGLGNTTEKEEFAADIYLVMHEDLRRSPKIRAVADFLGEVLAEQTIYME